jgi:anti-sigma factor RsiW
MNDQQLNSQHGRIHALLPWHAAGRLDPDDEALVLAHLETCAACTAELAWQRQLHGAASTADMAEPVPDMEAALGRLLPRLDERAPRPDLLARLAAWLRGPSALPVAFAVAVLALAVTLPSQDNPGYRGLGPVTQAGGDATVVFRPDTSATDVTRILRATGATAVRGPTVAGAYVLDIGSNHRAEALARLRAEPAVLMAEPLEAAP